MWRYGEIRELLLSEEYKLINQSRSQTRMHARTKTYAFELGPRLPDAEVRGMLDLSRAGEVTPKAPCSVGFVEDVPCLELSALVKAGMFRMPVCGHLATWKLTNAPLPTSAVIASDLRAAVIPQILIRPTAETGTTILEQWLKVVRSEHNSRLFFECLLTGARCDRLFLREGVFASARAHRLVSRSQRKS